MRMKNAVPGAWCLALGAWCLVLGASGADSLARGFAEPERAAKPYTWWHWMNGNITKEGITADLEAMKKIGLGGAQIFDIDYGIPRGKVDFASPAWFDCVKHAAKEARRLGLELALNTASGWSCAGGPWNTLTNGMKFITYTETPVKGPMRFAGKLKALPFEGNYRGGTSSDYIRDIAVIAYPTPADGSAPPITNFWQKTLRVRNQRASQFGGRFNKRPVAGGLVEAGREIDLTDKMSADGTLAWDVPAGDWTILRIGYCANHRHNYPPSAKGHGLECDKLSAKAQDAHWAGFIDKLLAHVGPDLVGKGKGGGVTGIIVDSYEAGSQNWTEGFEAEFERRAGYPIKPWLPVFAGRVVGSEELTDRFLEDFRRAVSDAFIENFGFATRRKAHAYGLELYVEPYGDDMPANDLEYAHCADVPMTEFWTGSVWPWRGDPPPAANEAWVWGKKTVAAESYTTWPKDDRWTLHPAAIKRITDYKFCCGINRIIYHTYAHQPWMDPKLWPGMTMGRFGIMFNRNVTWWDMGDEWIKYQARCQQMLRQGRAVVDAMFFGGEDAPCLDRVAGRKTFDQGLEYATLSREALMASKAEGGEVVTPGGLRARFLLLPEYMQSASPEVMRKIEAFAEAGVTVIGDPPKRAFGLKDRVAADEEVRRIVARMWARPNVKRNPAREAVKSFGLRNDFGVSAKFGVMHLHRIADDGSDFYFLAAQNDTNTTVSCWFRVKGRTPEIWDPVTGRIELARNWSEGSTWTNVEVPFAPNGSVFVVFRPKTTEGARRPANLERVSQDAVDGAWELSFPAGQGAPAKMSLDRLVSWTELPDEGANYFSGMATYRKQLRVDVIRPGERLFLDLGDVRDICEVSVDGKAFPALWTKPFRIEVTEQAGDGALDVCVKVANCGANRLIGDAKKPDDCTWTDKSWSGPHLTAWPDWMTNGQARASGRTTFTTWRHWTKDDKPFASGMLGPVTLTRYRDPRRLPEAKREKGKFTVAARGCRAPCRIVCRTGRGGPSVRYAAEELREHVAKITGVELDVANENDKCLPGEERLPRVMIGLTDDASLGDDGFEIRASGDTLDISGGKRGVLYGVHELLERFGGVMWLAPKFSHLPRLEAFTVPADARVREKPYFEERMHDTFVYYEHQAFAARCRLNEVTYDEKFGGPYPPFDSWLGKCHTFLRLVPPSKYYDTHPEYFSLVKGKRRRDHAQLCLTNPDVFKIVLSNVLARIEANANDRNPNRRAVRYYGVSQDDWNNYCECENCAAIDAREESHVGCVIWFVNKLAEEVEKTHPEAVIETLAYMYGRKPPKTLKPRDNVMICLCTIECDFSKPMATNRYKENVDFRTNVLKWREISKNLYIWDYAANWRATPVPYPNLTAYAENIKFYYEAGVRYLFEEGITSPSASITDLKGWLGAKLMWNPYQPAEPLIRRFCDAYYGKAAAPLVMEFFRLMEAQDIDETKTPITYAVPLERMPFTPEFYEKGLAIWTKAAQAAAGEEEAVRRNVAWGKFGLEYALAARYAQMGEWRAVNVSSNLASRLDRAEFTRMRALAQSCQRMLDSDSKAIVSSRLNDARLKGYLRALAMAEFPADDATCALVQDWAINYSDFPKSMTMSRVKDKDATDGSAISVNGEKATWSITCHLKPLLAIDKGGRYRMRMRLKVNRPEGEKPNKTLLSMGLFDRNTKKELCSSHLPAEKATGAYEWYDFGEWTEEGHECIMHVDPHGATFWIDCVEIKRVPGAGN